MHPIVIEQIARQHYADLLDQAERARAAAHVRGAWRQTAARLALAAARAADPAALDRAPRECTVVPARAH